MPSRAAAKLVVVDPVYTTTASKADLWLPVKPGKDVHLALAMMHTVFEDETYDEQFLRKRTTGPALVRKDTGDLLKSSTVFDDGSDDQVVAVEQGSNTPVELEPETDGRMPSFGSHCRRHRMRDSADRLRDHVADYAPSKVAEKTGVDAENIRSASDGWRLGPRWHAPSYAIGRCKHGHVFGQIYAMLMGLTGDYGRHGNIYADHAGGASLGTGGWGTPETPTPDRRCSSPNTRDAMIDGDPHKVRAVYSIESNMLGNQFPDRQKHLKAVGKLDMFVVADMHHTPTVQQADIVLPAAHWFETEGHRYLVGVPPAPRVPAQGARTDLGGRDDYYAVRDLASDSDTATTSRRRNARCFGNSPAGTTPSISRRCSSRGLKEADVPIVKYTDEFPTGHGAHQCTTMTPRARRA